MTWLAALVIIGVLFAFVTGYLVGWASAAQAADETDDGWDTDRLRADQAEAALAKISGIAQRGQSQG